MQEDRGGYEGDVKEQEGMRGGTGGRRGMHPLSIARCCLRGWGECLGDLQALQSLRWIPYLTHRGAAP